MTDKTQLIGLSPGDQLSLNGGVSSMVKALRGPIQPNGCDQAYWVVEMEPNDTWVAGLWLAILPTKDGLTLLNSPKDKIHIQHPWSFNKHGQFDWVGP